MTVNINVIDIQGKIVDTIKKDYHHAGYYHITWNANQFQSGIYFIQIITDEKTIVKKVILLK
jgi:flagellar hook assembly protein FlgD